MTGRVLFKRITKTSLFLVFFTAFIGIGFIPFMVVKYYVLEKVENEMRSSLNESYYLITERITDIIDRACIRRWVSNLGNLRSSMDFRVISADDVRQSLLNTFFRNEPEMVVLSLMAPDSESPLHFLKQEQLHELTRKAPDAVASLFKIQDTDTDAVPDAEWLSMGKPVYFKCCRKAFLPVEVEMDWDDGQKARLRCIYDLTPALGLMDSELSLGNKGLYVVNRTGDIVFHNQKSPSIQN